MKSMLVPVASAVVIAALSIFPASAESLSGGLVAVKPGVATPIYGVRGIDCKTAPEFSKLTLPAIAHGTFSDGGEGSRHSAACGKTVPVRIVNFTSNPDYRGAIRTALYGDLVTIDVRPPN
jgi:hypothetical protein